MGKLPKISRETECPPRWKEWGFTSMHGGEGIPANSNPRASWSALELKTHNRVTKAEPSAGFYWCWLWGKMFICSNTKEVHISTANLICSVLFSFRPMQMLMQVDKV
ncbi:hypothetical protein BABINDRAFT_163633, partial [Babjeviella inositovora NRRL Y-12698]